MPNLWSLITGPIFKHILVLVIGAVVGGLAWDWWKVGALHDKIFDLQKETARLSAEVQASRIAARSAQDAVSVAEEQCKGKVEHERKKPKDSIDSHTDVTPEYLDSFLGGVRKGGGKDSDKANAPGTRANPGPAPPKDR